MVNIEGLDKAKVLLELYNNSRQLGLGMLQPAKNLTIEEARELLSQTTYFDYLYGKVMKVDLSSDKEFDERLYDRDNGEGKAQSVVDRIRVDEKGAIEISEEKTPTYIPPVTDEYIVETPEVKKDVNENVVESKEVKVEPIDQAKRDQLYNDAQGKRDENITREIKLLNDAIKYINNPTPENLAAFKAELKISSGLAKSYVIGYIAQVKKNCEAVQELINATYNEKTENYVYDNELAEMIPENGVSKKSQL